MNNRNVPKFVKQNSHAKKRAQKVGWRKPRGIDSLQRKHVKSKGAIPRIGYSAPKSMRGLHPSGYEEIYVRTIYDLEKIDPTKQVARISATVGKRKKLMILKKADEMKIKVLNR